MRRTGVVAIVLGLGVLVTSPAFALAGSSAAGTGTPGSGGIEVHAALDVFLLLRPVNGEKRD